MVTENDIMALANMKEHLSEERTIEISVSVLEDVCYYCESMTIYDKLGNYGDFYYKIKSLLNK